MNCPHCILPCRLLGESGPDHQNYRCGRCGIAYCYNPYTGDIVALSGPTQGVRMETNPVLKEPPAVLIQVLEALELDADETVRFTSFYEALREAAPRLCANPRLLAVALGNVYHDATHVKIEGGLVAIKYRLTMKHIAHAASIERTLMSMEKAT